MPHLSAKDLADLCRQVDLSALLAQDGVEVRRRGAAYVCKLRPEERTASCHVYPPGVGRRPDRWTWHDYGNGWGGDTLDYLERCRGMTRPAAVAELRRLAGAWTPSGGETLPPARKPRQGPPRRLPGPSSWQLDAALALVDAVLAVAPDAAAQGAAYLASRGCLPAAGAVGCWVLPAEACKPLAARIAAGPDADLLTRAGLLDPAADGKPPRLRWWDRVALLGCYDAAGNLAYFVGRRLDWTEGDRWGKYMNQGTGGGAVRWPFNLCALYRAAGRLRCWPAEPDPAKAGDVLLVEGPLDALGAACLGWPAVALLTRLQAHDYKDRDGAAARMLEAHLPALRDVRRVLVVPDADPGTKGAEGEALAARLAGWLTFAGVRAAVARLEDLCPDAPEGCKDLADVAKARKEGRYERITRPI
jgi:hypothetical protein